MFKNFTDKEIFKVIKRRYKIKTWSDLPEDVKENLIHTMKLVQAIRSYLDIKLEITSNWRPEDGLSPHSDGKSVDIKANPLVKGWAKKAMEWLKVQTDWKGFRVFWEYQGNNEGWLHVERGYGDNGKNIFYIGYKQKGIMKYLPYTGKAPWEYTK